MTPEQIEKAKPMLASQLMVKNVLAGIQTQDRRPIKPQPNFMRRYGESMDVIKENIMRRAPYQVGDIIYLRETWAVTRLEGVIPGKLEYPNILYRADSSTRLLLSENRIWNYCVPKEKMKWSPSIHMPKWAARIFLEVKRVWVERIQDIGGSDVLAEGLNSMVHPGADYFERNQRDIFMRLWNSLYPGSWDRNDWVWAVEFKLLEVLTNAN